MSLAGREKYALCVAGLTAMGIGSSILATPHAFFANYGIALGDDASLLSELRAPAAGPLAFGVLKPASIWCASKTVAPKAVALTVFCAFPAGRIIGLVVDGWPSGPIIGALIFELVVTALCFVAFSRRIVLVHGSLSGTRKDH